MLTPSKLAFSKADREAIREAVDEAEGKTSGEIVPYVVRASDEYPEAAWKAAAIGGLGGVLLAALSGPLLDLWPVGWLWPAWFAGATFLFAAMAYLVIATVPSLKRRFVTREAIAERVRSRASLAFLAEEVFATRERTGILLFLSLFERRVVVLGDQGINQRVEPEEWQGLVDDLAAGVRDGRALAALIEAIGRCGEVLERRGVEIRHDDSDELADDLRFKES